MTPDIKSLYTHAKWALVVRGLFGIALGIFIFARPVESIAALALIIAIWALVDGIVSIVHAFDLRGIVQHWWAMLLSGMIGVAFGIAALYYYPVLSLGFAVVWSSLWLTTAGIVGIYVAVQERNIGVSWGWTLAFSIVAIAGGVFAIVRPDVTLASMIGIFATVGILGGIALLVGAGKMQSFQGEFARAERTMAR